MTALTTIIVATPSVTLTMLASAIQRVRRYRQQRSSLYIGEACSRVAPSMDGADAGAGG
jgi:hypothetical protein